MFRLFIALMFFWPLASGANEWDFEIEPYLLASSISGDNSIGRIEGAEVDLDMSDILETLEIAGMLHFEALQDDRWGVALDYTYAHLSDDLSGPRDGVVSVDSRQGIFQADLLYRQAVGSGSVDYIAGIRWWDIKLESTLDPAIIPGSVQTKVQDDWVDLYVGARWFAPINDQWTFVLRADVGGFGLESDFTSLVDIGVKYQIADNMLLVTSYQGLWVDYDNGKRGGGDYYAVDTVTHGPKFGFIYQF